MQRRISETYDSFWGQQMFVMHDPEHLWKVNRGRADWFEALELGEGLDILDLGCGNGYLDIVLGRRGHRVVGVDHVNSVVDAARELVGSEPVEFVSADLRGIDFPSGRFDVVFMFGLVGLMSKDEDAELVREIQSWLGSRGSLLVDCDLDLARTETTFTDHDLGRIHWNWTSDLETRTNRLTPELHRPDGAIVDLDDPIDPARGPHKGLVRYVYPIDELTHLLTTVGFEVSRVGHYLEFVFPETDPSAYMLLAMR